MISCIRMSQFQSMSQRQNEDVSCKQGERKNQKNVYVHKIKSLMRISRDNLHNDEKEISEVLKKKHIKKVHSEVDKTAIKLQKNRQSAKRARLRKKLYIKLLQMRVQKLREAALEGQRIEKESQKFLKMISKKQVREELQAADAGDEVEKYLSRQNLLDYKKAEQQQKEQICARMDKIVEQICQVSMSSSLRNIRQLSSQISLDEILQVKQIDQKKAEGQELQEIIKDVLIQTEELRSIFVEIVNQNQNVKRVIHENRIHDSPLHGFQESWEIKAEKSRGGLMPAEQFCSHHNKGSQEKSNIFINLTQAEKVVIQSLMFLEQRTLQDEEM